jgi:hypothetical protein
MIVIGSVVTQLDSFVVLFEWTCDLHATLPNNLEIYG